MVTQRVKGEYQRNTEQHHPDAATLVQRVATSSPE